MLREERQKELRTWFIHFLLPHIDQYTQKGQYMRWDVWSVGGVGSDLVLSLGATGSKISLKYQIPFSWLHQLKKPIDWQLMVSRYVDGFWNNYKKLQIGDTYWDQLDETKICL